MVSNNAKLEVAVEGKRAIVRICGRASFTCSADFKALVYDLHARNCREFVLELTGCTNMDSTFLGILARFAQKLGEPGEGAGVLTLWNPSPRIVELLDNLCVTQLFRLAQGQEPLGTPCTLVEPVLSSDKIESTRVALEAHQALMEVDPANVPKFKDVAEYMADDLKRLEGR